MIPESEGSQNREDRLDALSKPYLAGAPHVSMREEGGDGDGAAVRPPLALEAPARAQVIREPNRQRH